jgi:hypothetical protein
MLPERLRAAIFRVSARESEIAYASFETRETAEAALEFYFADGLVCESERPLVQVEYQPMHPHSPTLGCVERSRPWRVMFPG